MIKNAKKENNKLKLVLASSSRQREEILTKLNLKFTVVPANISENDYEITDPVELVRKLALEKAKSVSGLVEDAVIVAADTVVVKNNDILGKPKNEEEAVKTLQKLSGDQHQVITAVAVIHSQNGKNYTAHNITDVKMAAVSEKEINDYVETGEPLDKAGSYAIQGLGSVFIEEIKGSYYTVMGLPVYQLAKLLEKFDYGIL